MIFGLRVKLPPANLPPKLDGCFTLFIFIARRQVEKLRILIFMLFGLTLLEIKPESTSVVDALSTRSLTLTSGL